MSLKLSEIKVGDILYIHSVYGGEKLYGEVIRIRDESPEPIVLSFEGGWHVDSYPLNCLHREPEQIPA
jgi:hypothetical protein